MLKKFQWLMVVVMGTLVIIQHLQDQIDQCLRPKELQQLLLLRHGLAHLLDVWLQLVDLVLSAVQQLQQQQPLEL
jgi:hypothetical protein